MVFWKKPRSSTFMARLTGGANMSRAASGTDIESVRVVGGAWLCRGGGVKRNGSGGGGGGGIILSRNDAGPGITPPPVFRSRYGARQSWHVLICTHVNCPSAARPVCARPYLRLHRYRSRAARRCEQAHAFLLAAALFQAASQGGWLAPSHPQPFGGGSAGCRDRVSNPANWPSNRDSNNHNKLPPSAPDTDAPPPEATKRRPPAPSSPLACPVAAHEVSQTRRLLAVNQPAPRCHLLSRVPRILPGDPVNTTHPPWRPEAAAISRSWCDAGPSTAEVCLAGHALPMSLRLTASRKGAQCPVHCADEGRPDHPLAALKHRHQGQGRQGCRRGHKDICLRPLLLVL